LSEQPALTTNVVLSGI